jgi:hypothetical protein
VDQVTEIKEGEDASLVLYGHNASIQSSAVMINWSRDVIVEERSGACISPVSVARVTVFIVTVALVID